jgi:hypothetical protein
MTAWRMRFLRRSTQAIGHVRVLAFTSPDAAQQECCEPGFHSYFAWGCFRDFLSRPLPCTAEETPCQVRDTRSSVPRAYVTNRSTLLESSHLE